jgi:Suppressor of fused protein (SUFU)
VKRPLQMFFHRRNVTNTIISQYYANPYESVRQCRDTEVYQRLMGREPLGPIVTIPRAEFARAGVKDVDPRWLRCGVLTFPPREAATTFTFVTTGLTDAEYGRRRPTRPRAGLGLELRIDTANDEEWAKTALLRVAASQLVIAAGTGGGSHLLAHGDLVRTDTLPCGTVSEMTTFLATAAGHYELPTGPFELISLFAITDTERRFNTLFGLRPLITLLRNHTSYPINDLPRQGVA